MSRELIKKFRTQLGTKTYDELETTWLELLEANLPLDDLINLINLARRWAPLQLVTTLLWVLTTHLSQQKAYPQQLRVLRLLAEITPDDDNIPRQITTCLRNIYPDEPLLEKIIQKSGLGFGEKLPVALTKLDTYLNLLPDKIVYDSCLGVGRIKELDLLFDRVTIVFNAGTETTLDVLTANRQLTFPPPDGFFYQLANNPEQLRNLAQQNPAQLVLLLLRDLKTAAPPSTIQKFIQPLTGAENYPDFWEKARKQLTHHPHIEIQTRPQRTYRWLPQPVKKIPDTARTTEPDTTAPTPPIYSAEEISRITPAQLPAVWQALNSLAEKRKFLEALMQNRSEDWDELYSRLFLITDDRRIKNIIAQKLQKDKSAVWQKLVETVLTDYRSQPHNFLFLIENYPPASALFRLLDLMEHAAAGSDRSLVNKIKKLLIKDNYRIIQQSLKEIDNPTALKLLDRIRRSRALEPFQQDEITSLFLTAFPSLKERQEGKDVIWSSAAGIQKAKAELKRLTEEELPRVTEEIARARAFGDLSENYEYKAAKEKQARLMAKINRLSADISRAKPLQPEKIDTSRVNIGCRVKLKDDSGTISEWTILGPWDADLEKNIISYQSPFARQLLGRTCGERVVITDKNYEITEITSAL